MVPAGGNNFFETGIPSVRAVSLSRSKLPLLSFVKSQARLAGLGSGTGAVVKPRTNFLVRSADD